MSDTPRISVVMSLYNSERYLREAIDSVLSQTFADFEFIIVDDGSQDGSADIVQSYDDVRIRCIQQENKGLPAALNVAIRAARTKLIARMDPDDICLPGRLVKQYDYLRQHPDVMVVGSAAMCIDEYGEPLAEISKTSYLNAGHLTMPETPCIHPSVMFRYAAFERVGGYPERMRYGGEDAVIFNKILSFAAVANLSDILLMYRLSPSSMSQKSWRFNVLLRNMIRRHVLNEAINDDEWEKMVQEYQRPGSGEFGYHLYIGKLFLRGDKYLGKARMHLRVALCQDPISLHVWLCLISSLMPLSWRTTIRTLRQK